MNAPLYIIFSFLLLAILLGIRARKGKNMNLEQWSVGGRGFGTVLIFLLSAGEIYTTFSFLGASSWAYGKGAPAFYIIAYVSLQGVLAYWIFPVIWKYAKEHHLISQSDFFVSKYKSSYLGTLVAFIGVIAIIPYIVLQLKGLGIIVSVASYGLISPDTAVWIGVIAVTLYVMVSGIHGSAWTAVIKDIMIFVIVVFIGIYIPFHYYGGLKPMFKEIQATKQGFLTLPGSGLSISWFISTVLMTSLGPFVWPHIFMANYSAKNAKAIRKNYILMPLYTLMLLFIFFVGFAAIGQIPNLKGSESDLVLLKLSIKTFNPWFVGLIGATGLLTALVPGSMLLMTASTSLAKNVYKVFVPNAREKQVTSLAKYLVPVISLVCVGFTLNNGKGIVLLLLMGFSFITQLFPALVFSLMKNNFVTKQGAGAGMIAGVITVAYITFTNISIASLFPSWPQVMKDLNVGIIALILNTSVTVTVSLIIKKPLKPHTEVNKMSLQV